ncbi:MAG: hypothetical protein ETSY1_21085 [Candidatus Entotheonella factor]|uniref:Haem-binding uptake Tiki superfamily ChaN domain-containing protein n=1 Tax=Entotheonella factor TaxID=1429438 RepID=W4LID6_ENTF1|nr:MAG: hypothetical protein ETSY1_21085 [Candidatus Entotheonella factor]
MRRISLACLGFTLAVLTSCSHVPNRAVAQLSLTPLNHFYDFQLVRSTDQQPIVMTQLVAELLDSDVIFIGELHGHSASHYLQVELLAGLYQHNANLILSMEQFERDKQTVVNEYLDDKIGEQTLIAQGKAWPNYVSDYRPLVEFAKARQIPVIAANAPKALVRCIALKGPAIVDQLPAQQRAYLADDLTQSSTAYQAKFRKVMTGSGAWHGHAKPKHKPGPHGSHAHGAKNGKLSNSFYAQLARDNTMAESIAKALDAHPNHQVVAINGAFHSDGRLGTVDALQRLKPNVQIVVLSPHEQTEDEPDLAAAAKQGDYLYTIQTMPKRYVQKQHRDRAVMNLIKKRKDRECAW